MGRERRMEFCVECRHVAEYVLKKKMVSKTIRDREYSFCITTAICSECGAEMSIPGLIDKNVEEIDAQYREMEGIVSVEDIEKLLKIYKLGKAPASYALGFGEVTISRYLSGQVPSKEYSDIIKKAFTSPAFMKKLLIENREKVGETAYNKAMSAASSLQNLFSISEKMLSVIAYIFLTLEEVTPLMLQKLLYYIQGIYSALYDTPIFFEDCRAWVHGPVFEEIYNLFKEFKYNPIDDARFAILEGSEEALTDNERDIIDLVLNTFGMYGGKTLERITHKEEPWLVARKGYDDGIPSQEIIPKESIQRYFKAVDKEYCIRTEKGLRNYINDMIQ